MYNLLVVTTYCVTHGGNVDVKVIPFTSMSEADKAYRQIKENADEMVPAVTIKAIQLY